MIGREGDADELRSALATGRLVTLIGTGGVGKTRLAVEGVATDSDAVWCDLARIAADGAVQQAITAAAGVIVPREMSTMTAVIAELAGSPVTLVLDNCEHVLDGVRAAVVDLLRSCPELTILATSRPTLAIEVSVTGRGRA